jgi:Fe2+ or Zn2+ uptake regulation protein
MWYLNHDSAVDIARLLFLSKSTVNRVRNRFDAGLCVTGDSARARRRRRDLRLNQHDLGVLQVLVQGEASMYLDELADALHAQTGTRASLPTICRALRHQLQITRKLEVGAGLTRFCRTVRPPRANAMRARVILPRLCQRVVPVIRSI